MTTPKDARIAAGVPHRALTTLEVLVYDYDELGVKTTSMQRGTLFQPWEPMPHWRGEEVPITIGDDAKEFDWGITSIKGHFLRWDDFFERCARADDTAAQAKSRIHEQSLASPFAELDAIAARLRANARSDDERAAIDAASKRLRELRDAHTAAMESEMAALGFDNTSRAREYVDAQNNLLAEARALLASLREHLR